MIDLHIHSNYSDGTDTIEEILKKSEELGLEYISITDHDNCDVYNEIEKMDISKYYSGEIISGIEIKCSYKKRLIEVLGYKINTHKMQEWVSEYYKDKSRDKIQGKYFKLLHEKCIKMGLVLSNIEDIKFNPEKDWASVVIYKELKKHTENIGKLPEDMLSSFDIFSKKYCADNNHPLHIDKTEDYPTLKESIDVIKKCNGLVFLPHIFIYSELDKKKFLEDIVHNYKVDGIECMHSSFDNDEIEYLLDYCKKNNYYISGGSDYHGGNKDGIDLGVGSGNLKIQSYLIKDWIQ